MIILATKAKSKFVKIKNEMTFAKNPNAKHKVIVKN